MTLMHLLLSVDSRAALYVPGNDESKIKKIPSLNVDCVILDCEDGVALNRKVCIWCKVTLIDCKTEVSIPSSAKKLSGYGEVI